MSGKWIDEYGKKLTTADEAVKIVKSGDWVELGFGAGMAPALMSALAKRSGELENVNLRDTLWLPAADGYLSGAGQKAFNINTWFISARIRKAINEGIGSTYPEYFHEIPGYYTKYLENDVLMVSVSPMDEHGYFSFGTAVTYHRAAADISKKVILEVNEHQPYINGDSFIHISQVDLLVENHEPLPAIPAAPLTPNDEVIGQTVADMIEDGSTVQLGIGAMPNAVGYALKNKKDLGIHTEMFVDSMIDLIEMGVITGKKKTIHKERIIGTFAGGSHKLYKYLNRNPIFESYPVSYTNDPTIIAKNHKMVAINATAEVDLGGQCASESVGTRMLSGTGGQMDYCRGAYKSEGGKSFLCLHSTAKKGAISKIVPTLTPGAVVTTPRTEVQYIVTEYGVAMLKGKTLKERANELIAIAHPEFRNELRNEAKRLKIL
ncbi:MAG: acetyl-CoA hydrolase/transferase C-terminal domain-containing protein [Syntrophales bacterium]|jgi:acyl-CoA hydrolase